MSTLPFLDLPPIAAVAGTVRVPGSKSISNRALLLAGFGSGTTLLEGLLDADDTRVMRAALRALGCTVERRGPDAFSVTGLAGAPRGPGAPLELGNAGTAMRPLVAALAVAGAPGTRYALRGSARMHERPIADLADALRALGVGVAWEGTPGYPPLAIVPPARLAIDGPIRVRGDVSSQFLTSLLLALPLRRDAGRAVTIEVEGELISTPYVEITLRLLEAFGVAVEREGWRAFHLPAGAAPRAPGRYAIEGDASSASYFVAAGAVAATPEAPLRIEGVGAGSIQGDLAFVAAVRAMGADVTVDADAVTVRRGRMPLAPVRIDCLDIPDAAMTLAALALHAEGTSRLEGIGSWRVKETDRIAAMAAELAKTGATVASGDDWLEVTPGPRRAAAIATYDDHRMAMALSLAALAGGDDPAAVPPLRILDPATVGKTYPGYWAALFAIARTPPALVPVIAIDGPTASGKGTLASAVAARLGYRLLDSGAVYRAAAVAALDAGVAADDAPALGRLAARLAPRLAFAAGRTTLDGLDVTERLRDEATGTLASRISALPGVRAALLDVQLAFRRPPGLVADGRDMGTVVFPDAQLKIFLTAGPSERAVRRHRQLLARGVPATLDDLRADLEARDERDRNRAASPLRPAEDAILLDNSGLDVDASVERVLEAWEARRPFP
jgi:3-phosphoshikimate 1-carboxyvinyltransferase